MYVQKWIGMKKVESENFFGGRKWEREKKRIGMTRGTNGRGRSFRWGNYFFFSFWLQLCPWDTNNSHFSIQLTLDNNILYFFFFYINISKEYGFIKCISQVPFPNIWHGFLFPLLLSFLLVKTDVGVVEMPWTYAVSIICILGKFISWSIVSASCVSVTVQFRCRSILYFQWCMLTVLIPGVI